MHSGTLIYVLHVYSCEHAQICFYIPKMLGKYAQYANCFYSLCTAFGSENQLLFHLLYKI